MILGVITYDHNHFKTEQILKRLILDKNISKIKLYGLKFDYRAVREVIFKHRPDQNLGQHPKEFEINRKVKFNLWDGNKYIHDECDYFIISGAGLIDVGQFKEKIFNVHPGIIPISRGLDSFKWAIYSGKPLGVTLHIPSEEIDLGAIKRISYTPVLAEDTLSSLSIRHYKNEIDTLINFIKYINTNLSYNYKIEKATKRMNSKLESEMIKRFPKWKKNQINNKSQDYQ